MTKPIKVTPDQLAQSGVAMTQLAEQYLAALRTAQVALDTVVANWTGAAEQSFAQQWGVVAPVMTRYFMTLGSNGQGLQRSAALFHDAEVLTLTAVPVPGAAGQPAGVTLEATK